MCCQPADMIAQKYAASTKGGRVARAAARGTGRGRRLGLTRERVLAAATQMIDRDGLDGFSLRRLGAALDVEPMSLYNHVAGKDAVLDGVAERLLAEVDYTPDPARTWQEHIRDLAAAFRETARRNPRSFPLVITRLVNAPGALTLIRAGLVDAADLAFTPAQAVHVLRGFAAYLVGAIVREFGSTAAFTGDPDQIRQRVEDITAFGDPLLTAIAPHLAVCDYDAEFRYGLELFIAGLATHTGHPYDGGPPPGAV